MRPARLGTGVTTEHAAMTPSLRGERLVLAQDRFEPGDPILQLQPTLLQLAYLLLLCRGRAPVFRQERQL